jgi:hypothetical protein
VPLPGTSYKNTWAFIVSKSSPYKGLINWRWEDNKIKSVRYMNESSLELWVPCKLPKTKTHVHLSLRHKRLNSIKVCQDFTFS